MDGAITTLLETPSEQTIELADRTIELPSAIVPEETRNIREELSNAITHSEQIAAGTQEAIDRVANENSEDLVKQRRHEMLSKSLEERRTQQMVLRAMNHMLPDEVIGDPDVALQTTFKKYEADLNFGKTIVIHPRHSIYSESSDEAIYDFVSEIEKINEKYIQAKNNNPYPSRIIFTPRGLINRHCASRNFAFVPDYNGASGQTMGEVVIHEGVHLLLHLKYGRLPFAADWIEGPTTLIQGVHFPGGNGARNVSEGYGLAETQNSPEAARSLSTTGILNPNNKTSQYDMYNSPNYEYSYRTGNKTASVIVKYLMTEGHDQDTAINEYINMYGTACSTDLSDPNTGETLIKEGQVQNDSEGQRISDRRINRIILSMHGIDADNEKFMQILVAERKDPNPPKFD